MSQDWRDFIKELDENGEVNHVSEEVKREYEITSLMMELDKQHRYPVMIFDKVADSEFPVLTNILGTRERFARGLGELRSNPAEIFSQRINDRYDEVRVVADPPFMANSMEGDEVDLYKLPIVTHFPIDAGPYVTSGLCVAKDPESGAETLGFHRMQLKNKNTLGISLHSRQRLWEYFRRSEEQGKN
ncbi:MAG: UbiD family decarboxylase, partial [Bacillota bacterium]|nr:UbiD family decarboxylase [Bacillota bacterium]